MGQRRDLFTIVIQKSENDFAEYGAGLLEVEISLILTRFHVTDVQVFIPFCSKIVEEVIPLQMLGSFS